MLIFVVIVVVVVSLIDSLVIICGLWCFCYCYINVDVMIVSIFKSFSSINGVMKKFWDLLFRYLCICLFVCVMVMMVWIGGVIYVYRLLINILVVDRFSIINRIVCVCDVCGVLEGLDGLLKLGGLVIVVLLSWLSLFVCGENSVFISCWVGFG